MFNFIDEYVRYKSEHSSLDPNLHKLMAFGILSSCLARTVFIKQGDYTIYPNLFALVVAPPGSGKSTALASARNLLTQAGFNPPMPSNITAAALFDEMEENPLNHAFISEFSTFFPTSLNEFKNELPQTLIDLYDGVETSKRTKKDGKKTISEPLLTLIGCTTPEVLTDYYDIFAKTGLGRRFISYSLEPTPMLKKPQAKTFPQPLITHLRNLPLRPLEIRLEIDLPTTYPTHEEPLIRDFLIPQNLEAQITKLTILSAFSRTPLATSITQEDLTYTLNFFLPILNKLPSLWYTALASRKPAHCIFNHFIKNETLTKQQIFELAISTKIPAKSLFTTLSDWKNAQRLDILCGNYMLTDYGKSKIFQNLTLGTSK